MLAKIQATQRILRVSHCTMHMDGMSRGSKKIVGQQITLNTGETLSLGFTPTASEDAATLLEMTIHQLQEMGDLYCDATDDNKDQVFKALLKKLTSFMTDRAAVMKKFDADLLQFIRTQVGQETAVHFLRCNAHYLLGLSQSTELALQAAEKAARETAPVALGRDQHAKFGFFKSKEIATFKLIRTASDVTGPQGDQKMGCRMERLAYCEEKEVRSRMTSYCSNRFNLFLKELL